MPQQKIPDIVAGLIVALFGLAVALYAADNYSLGTLRRMGPGMLPMALGGLIGLLGLALSVSTWLREGDGWDTLDEIQWKPAILVVISVIAFSMIIQPFGLIPAVIAVVGISAFADSRANLFNVSVLSAVLCVIAYVIFRVALGLNFKIFGWPF